MYSENKGADQLRGPKCEHRIYSKFMMKGCLRLVINKWSRCNKMPYILEYFNKYVSPLSASVYNCII